MPFTSKARSALASVGGPKFTPGLFLPTFSTFSLETVRYLRDDAIGLALTYVAISLVVGMSATAAGILAARSLFA